MTLIRTLRLVFIVFATTISVFCFNLESRDPIVKRGTAGSYFGYSVALHKSEDDSDIRNSWLLVGAPLGQNLQPDANNSGALFKCPIYNSNEQRDCIQVPTDGRRPADFDYEEVIEKAPVQLRPPGNDEIKENQWLGVNVRSQGPGGKVIVCAHRYIWSQNLNLTQHGLGLCYSLNKELEWEEQWEPCKGRAVLLEHQQFGYCQAGTSLALLSDGTALIGSPGPFTWRGTLFVLSIAGDFLSREKNVYLGPLNDKPEPINKYSYLGMSVAAGKFLSGYPISYAAGAPRSQDHGQVYIFNKNQPELEMNISLILDGEQIASNFGYEILAADFNKDGFDDLLVAAPFFFSGETGGGVSIYYNLRTCPVRNCTRDQLLRGTLESRFGFALANIGDINRDGYIDLAVGAPYEGNGAIYIYLGSKNGIIEKHSQKIHPEWDGIKTLGYSLSGGMDMDNYGYTDLLTGAYDSDAVLLFKTRPIIGIETKVNGTELTNINTTFFGCGEDPYSPHKCFSFNACFNITSDSNIDNVVVRYHIKEVFEESVSRIWFKRDDPDIKHNYYVRHIKLQKHVTEYCQNETVYFPNTTIDILSPIKFRVNYTLANDEPHSPILNQTSINNFQATFQKDCGLDDVCQSELIMSSGLMLNKTTEHQYLLNLGDLEEFQVEVNVTNKGDPAYEAKVFVIFPLSVRYIDLTNKSRSFRCSKKNETLVSCDIGNPLRADNLVHLQLRFETKDVGNQSRLTLENELTFFVFVNSTSEELSNQTSSNLTAVVSRKAEVKLIVGHFTRTLLYSGEVKGEKAMKTLDDVGSIVVHEYQIQQAGPMSYADVEVAIAWPWQVANDKPQGKWLLYLEEINITDGREKDYCYVDPADAINVLNLTKSNTASPLLGTPKHTNLEKTEPKEKSAEGEKIDKTEKTVTTETIMHTERTERNETWEHWEKSEHRSVNLTSDSLLLESFPNSNDETESYFSKLIRLPRSTEYVVPAETITGADGKKRQVVIMDCRRNTAKCITIRCKFPKLPKRKITTITIKSRLWNSTLVEDYSQINWVQILSNANATIEDPSIEMDEKSQPHQKIPTNAYPDLSIQLDGGVPLWIIILAVVAGLLVLILLIFVLWRVGFFKRNRIKDPTLSGNLTKQSEQETLLNK